MTIGLSAAYQIAITNATAHLRANADAVAADFQVDNATALQTIWEGLAEKFRASPTETDGRTANWRCRFRIYREGQDEPEADSDDDKRPDAPGSMVIAGLPNVAAEVIALASAFHSKGSVMVLGLSREELARKLAGLRPTLSRRGGNAVWRLSYSTVEATLTSTLANRHGDISTPGTERNWLMRVDIIRETETQT